MSTATVLVRAGRAEWSRSWSVRSSWVFALVIAVVLIGFGAVVGADAASDPSDVSPGSTAWDGGRLSGMFALFGIVAMAVVTSTADSGTGGIVATLQWTPRRVVLLTARTGVILATTTVLGLGLVTRNTAAALVIALALILIAPLLLAQFPYDWTLTAATHLPGSGALFLVFGEGPSDDMTTTSARLTLAAWAVAALTAGGWRLLQSDANR